MALVRPCKGRISESKLGIVRAPHLLPRPRRRRAAPAREIRCLVFERPPAVGHPGFQMHSRLSSPPTGPRHSASKARVNALMARPDDGLRRGPSTHRRFSDYGMPACAGMTGWGLLDARFRGHDNCERSLSRVPTTSATNTPRA
jgi:hypothetical protein